MEPSLKAYYFVYKTLQDIVYRTLKHEFWSLSESGDS